MDGKAEQMSANTFILLTTAYGEESRINANLIESYTPNGGYTLVTLSSGQIITVKDNCEDIDKLLTETYFIVKRI